MLSSLKKKHLNKFCFKVSTFTSMQLWPNTPEDWNGWETSNWYCQILVTGCIFCLESSRNGESFQTSGSNAAILRKYSDRFLARMFRGSLSVDVGWVCCWIISTSVKKFKVETTKGFPLFTFLVFYAWEFPWFLCTCRMRRKKYNKLI